MEENMIGTKIAGYKLEESVERGRSIGAVWKAFNPTTGVYAAVKTIPPQYLTGKAGDRFKRGAWIQGQLKHPNIVPVITAGIVEDGKYKGVPYIVMDYMENGSLDDTMKASEEPFSPEFVINLSLQVLDALDYAHTKSIVHHDLHPGNILFDKDNRAHVSDFELAELMVEETKEGYLYLKNPQFARYIPPELTKRQKGKEPVRLLPQGDIYSWSVVMFELLTGGNIPNEVPFKRLTEINAKVPKRLEEIIMQGMAGEPKERFPVKTGTSASAMRNELYKLTPKGIGEEITKIIQSYEPRISSILERKVPSETLDVRDIEDLNGVREQLYRDLEGYGVSSDAAKKHASGIEKLIGKRRESDAVIMKSYLTPHKKNVGKIRDGRRRREIEEKLKYYIRVAHVWGLHEEGECPVARGEVKL